MGVRQYNPTSAGRRAGSVSDFAECTFPKVNKPEKSLLVRRKKSGGRNNQGIITSRFRGGGHKQMLRLVDFKRKKDGIEAIGRVGRVRSVPVGADCTPAIHRR